MAGKGGRQNRIKMRLRGVGGENATARFQDTPPVKKRIAARNPGRGKKNTVLGNAKKNSTPGGGGKKKKKLLLAKLTQERGKKKKGSSPKVRHRPHCSGEGEKKK